MSPSELDLNCRRTFERHYGETPRWIASAPGRVNLIGEYTDYNGGFVLPMAIERRTHMAARPNGSSRVTVYSQTLGEGAQIDLSGSLNRDPNGGWSNYVRGVLNGFRSVGVEIQGFDVLVDSTVPVGAGLSSSAAFTSALATLLEKIAGVTLEPLCKVLLCQQTEHTHAGVPCGIMDPYICTLAQAGRTLLLDCRSNEATWLKLDDTEVSVLIINSRVKHQHAGGAYAVRRRSCEEAVRAMNVTSLREANEALLNRHRRGMSEEAHACARHVIREIARTSEAAECLSRRDWEKFGALLYESHESLKNDFRVSCPELDAMVAAAYAMGAQRGIYGARLTGGGFGGCVVALIQTDRREEIEASIESAYRHATGIDAGFLVSHPAPGARAAEV